MSFNAMKKVTEKILESGTEEDIKILFNEIRRINFNYRKMKDKTILKRILDKDPDIFNRCSATIFKEFLLRHIDLCIELITEIYSTEVMQKILNDGTEKQIDKFYLKFSRMHTRFIEPEEQSQLNECAYKKPMRAACLLVRDDKRYVGPVIKKEDREKLYETMLQDPEAILYYYCNVDAVGRCPRAEEVIKNASNNQKYRYFKAIVYDNILEKYESAAVAFIDTMIVDNPAKE